MPDNYPKYYRLSDNKLIEQIAKHGNKVVKYPVLIKWLWVDNLDSQAKIAISISKHKIKRAVKRNKIKRRIKEVLRQNKDYFLKDKKLALLIVYLDNTILPYDKIKSSLLNALQEIN